MRPALITLLTDFGTADAYVGLMKGVILGLAPDARLVDLTHAIPPQSVEIGALVLRSAVPYFPEGSIHLAVVDPGVGSGRAAVAVQTRRAWFVGPDNGLLAPAAESDGIERVIELRNPRYGLAEVSHTFHGRDVFAPAAAHLAAGVAAEELGPPRPRLAPLAGGQEPRRLEDGLEGEVIYVDGFGNLITNIGARDLTDFRSRAVSVSIAQCSSIPLVSTYSDVAVGEPAALIGSWSQLEIAVRGGSAAQHLAAGRGTFVRLIAE